MPVVVERQKPTPAMTANATMTSKEARMAMLFRPNPTDAKCRLQLRDGNSALIDRATPRSWERSNARAAAALLRSQSKAAAFPAISRNYPFLLATPAGLEPATCRLEGGCSI